MYCETNGNGSLPNEPYQFKVAYDKLVIGSGAEPLTFGIKGVKEHAFFLREVTHAQEIRKKLLLNLMLSENPGECFLCVQMPYIIMALPSSLRERGNRKIVGHWIRLSSIISFPFH